MIYFGVNCALASISAFLPTIIQTFGYSACQHILGSGSDERFIITDAHNIFF